MTSEVFTFMRKFRRDLSEAKALLSSPCRLEPYHEMGLWKSMSDTSITRPRPRLILLLCLPNRCHFHTQTLRPSDLDDFNDTSAFLSSTILLAHPCGTRRGLVRRHNAGPSTFEGRHELPKTTKPLDFSGHNTTLDAR